MFNHLDQKALDLHVTILGWFHIIGHAIFLVIGLFVFMLLTGIGAASGEVEAVAVLGVVGSSVGLLLSALALPGLLSGYGLLTRKPWGRVLGMVVGLLNLINFPLGTVVGLYTLWVLLQETATAYFKVNGETMSSQSTVPKM